MTQHQPPFWFLPRDLLGWSYPQRLLGWMLEFWRACRKRLFSRWRELCRVFFGRLLFSRNCHLLGLDASNEIMSNETTTFTKADEAIDFLVNQGKPKIFVTLGCVLKTTAEFLWNFVNCYHVFADLSAPKVRINVDTSLAVEKIESIAYDDGLQPDQLVNLVKLATNGKYG